MTIRPNRPRASFPLSPPAALALGVIALAPFACRNRNQPDPPDVQQEYSEVTRAFTPEWYAPDPESEGDRLVTTAQAVGANQTISETLAINQARQSMALTIDSQVDVLQRNFQEQVEAADDLQLLQRFQDVNTIVASRALRGSRVTRKETYVNPDGGYRTFVKMELDARQIDAAYLEQLRQMEELETRLRSAEAWKELQRRAEELREQRGFKGLPPMTDEEIMGDDGDGDN